MTVTDSIGKTSTNATGQAAVVSSTAQLHALGLGYGMRKLASGPPHGSDDGH